MSEVTTRWTEDDSTTYQNLAVVAVPDREEQIATIAALLPHEPEAVFTVLELGSGEGYLSEVILECFPHVSVHALDGSEEMRRTTAKRLERFGSRFTVDAFDIEDLSWLDLASGVDCVVSSLCVHHLHGQDKQRMFAGLAQRLKSGGALIVADLIEPTHPVVRQYLADTWDHETQQRSHKHLDGDAGWQAFQDEQWNLYRYPDEMDRPSPLADQLAWLADAGFDTVDCFWMKAGHAVYGGYLARGAEPENLVGFERALAASRAALEAR